MKSKKTNIKTYTRAFTIVELLVVMAVIGILITLAVVGIQALQRSQRETVIANDLRNIQGALVQYYAKYRQYPSVSDDLSDELKFDGQGAKQGLCLTLPFKGDIVAEKMGGDYICDIETTDSVALSYIFSRITTEQLGIYYNPPDFTTGSTYSGWNCSNFDTQGGNAWMLGYISGFPGEYPQEYALFACTENGKSINYGGGRN